MNFQDNNFHTIEQIVEFMNDSTEISPESIAAEYAIHCTIEEKLGGIPDENLEAHLDFLTDAGGNFDLQIALEMAISKKKH